MRIVVAGAAGVIGRQLLPMLLADGHVVTGTTRSPERAAWLRGLGAEAVLLDLYDAKAVRKAVVAAKPNVLIHQLTDLAAGFGPDALRANTRLRIVGTRHLVEATLAAGAGRLVAQSGAWLYAPGRGGGRKRIRSRLGMISPCPASSSWSAWSGRRRASRV